MARAMIARPFTAHAIAFCCFISLVIASGPAATASGIVVLDLTPPHGTTYTPSTAPYLAPSSAIVKRSVMYMTATLKSGFDSNSAFCWVSHGVATKARCVDTGPRATFAASPVALGPECAMAVATAAAPKSAMAWATSLLCRLCAAENDVNSRTIKAADGVAILSAVQTGPSRVWALASREEAQGGTSTWMVNVDMDVDTAFSIDDGKLFLAAEGAIVDEGGAPPALVWFPTDGTVGYFVANTTAGVLYRRNATDIMVRVVDPCGLDLATGSIGSTMSAATMTATLWGYDESGVSIICSVSLLDGTVRWTRPLGISQVVHAIASSTLVVVSGRAQGGTDYAIEVLNATTGSPVATLPRAASDATTAPLLFSTGGLSSVAYCKGGLLTVADVALGATASAVRQTAVSCGMTPVLSASSDGANAFIVASGAGQENFTVVDATSLNVTWAADTAGPLAFPPQAFDDGTTIAAVRTDGNVIMVVAPFPGAGGSEGEAVGSLPGDSQSDSQGSGNGIPPNTSVAPSRSDSSAWRSFSQAIVICGIAAVIVCAVIYVWRRRQQVRRMAGIDGFLPVNNDRWEGYTVVG